MNLKKTLMVGAAGAALFAFAAPVATTAEAGSIKNGNATDLKVYGQVNRNMMFYNDGEDTGYRHQDGDNGSTRFGLKATGKVNESVSVGATLEMEMQSNDPGSSVQDAAAEGGKSFSERLAYVYFSHKQFGKLTLGQQSQISDGMSDGLDLGYAAGAFAGFDPALLNTGLQFRNNATGALAGSSHDINDYFRTVDGGRADAIQYETPSLNGFRLQAGLEDNGVWGLGGLYDGKHGSMQVRVRAFYENRAGADTSADTVEGQWQVGASVKHDSGISLSGLYGQRDQADRSKNRKSYGATIGYTANMNSLGATGIGVHYQGTEDWQAVGADGTSFGFGVNQQIKAAGTNIYGNVMYWDADSATLDLDSIVTFLVGAQVKF